MHSKMIDIVLKLMSANFSSMIGLEFSNKHCSAIIHKNSVISVGFNKFKTSQIAFEYGYLHGEYHAELDALIQVHDKIMDFNKEDLTLINFRLNRFSNVRISRPCPKCTRWANGLFSTFVYTDKDESITIEDVDSGNRELMISAKELKNSLGWKEVAQNAKCS